jgi:ribosomal protein L7/L12
MSTGTQILLGVCLALVLFALVTAARRRTPAERRPVTGELTARVRALAAEGREVVAIKELRQATGMGLREAREHVLGQAPPARRRDDDLVQTLVADGKKILAIKELRERTGMGLREARDYVEALAATGEPPAPPRTGVSDATLARARELKAAGKVVLAVKVVREETGWGLKECKDVVDQMPGRGRTG